MSSRGRCSRARPRRLWPGRPRHVATVTTGACSCSRGGRLRSRCGPARDRSRRPPVGRGARPGLGRRAGAMLRAAALAARTAAALRARVFSLRGRGHLPHEARHGLGHSVVRILGCRRVDCTRWQPRIRLLRPGLAPEPGTSQPMVPLVCELPNPLLHLRVWLARHAWHGARARRKGRSRPPPDGRGGRGRPNPRHGGVEVGGRSRRRVSQAGVRSGRVAVGGRSRGRVSCGPVGGRSVVLTGLIYMYLNIS